MKQNGEAESGRLVKTIAGAGIYAGAGMMFEVAFTGLGRGPKRNFHGGVSLLMGFLYVAVYAVSPWLFRLIDQTRLRHVLLRAVPITVLIYAFEWGFGELCYAIGLEPWRYGIGLWRDLGLAAAPPGGLWGGAVRRVLDVSHGAITLEMLPIWYPYAVAIEPVLKTIRRAVEHLYADGLLTWKGFWALVGSH
jgi:hypothetical protein